MTEQNWCLDFFDDAFSEAYLVRELRETISFLKEKLHLKQGDLVFDQCCGIGNISIALAEAGFKTVGVDLIDSYIQRARHQAKQKSLSCVFTRADACHYITSGACDAALNWWTSFGYFADDAKNISMLTCVNRSLKRDGWFALDYMNSAERMSVFNDTTPLKTLEKGGYWETQIDSQRQMLVKNWFYTGADGKAAVKQGGGVRLYTVDDLQNLFKKAGFSDIQVYGSVGGEVFSPVSPRCILVGRKVEEC